jgi:DNA-binding response OmpR family regulator
MENNIEIVIIEDDEDILELIEFHLQKEGYGTVGFLSAENVEQFLEEETPSLMIVDRNLPGIEGSEFVAYLRDRGYDVPVIFLTAKDMDHDMDEGYDRGGDDYMTKPFRPQELLHRVTALLKRSGALSKQDKLKYKDITLDMLEKTAYINSHAVSLTLLEFNLLSIFLKNINKPLSRETLREQVWGSASEEVNDTTVNVAINRLKKKIDPSGEKEYFVPIWGVGYKFN